MFLIMSAAYVDLELQSEFGALPPSFLPLGNRRLFQHQNNIIPDNCKKYISLPESYHLSKMDKEWLEHNSFTIIYAPDGLSLGASLVATLNLIDQIPLSTLHVMFGDTLFSNLPKGNDIIALSEVEDSYNWATIDDYSESQLFLSPHDFQQKDKLVVCGYFTFSQPKQLVRNIIQNHWDFLAGLKQYNKQTKLQAVNAKNWLDFGHVNTYYRSKAKFTTQRAFNKLKINADYIEKSSTNNQKIKAEANWFCKFPFELRNYIPQFMGSYKNNGQFSYRLEYLHHTALNELYVFSKLPPLVWKNIFNSCIQFLKNCQTFSSCSSDISSSLEQLFTEKTKERLTLYCTDNNINQSDLWNFDGKLASLNQLLNLSEKYLPKSNNNFTVIHGDFCFSNILYDFRTHRIKVIDPRGLDNNGEITIFGDIRYDIAKLSHSIIGMYDWILAGYYSIKIKNQVIEFSINQEVSQEQEIIKKLFIEIIEKEFNLTAQNLYAMQIQLFLSMLPLHSDDKNRQNALFANAFHLYNILSEQIK